MTPFLITTKDNSSRFSIESNGDFILNGKKIGVDKKLAQVMVEYAGMYRKYSETSIQAFELFNKYLDENHTG